MFKFIRLSIFLLLFALCLCQKKKVPLLKLIDGRKMPQIGLGTLTITNETIIKNVVEEGLKIGYRHIDTAYFYMNEHFIGEKLSEIFNRKGKHRLQRKDIFITSKLWSTYHSRRKVREGLRLALDKLKTTYLDMFLIHFPIGLEEGKEDLPLYRNGLSRDSNISVVETWKGMEDGYRQGLARSIGVSNFNIEQLARILKQCQIKPVVNQIEVNPYLTENRLVKYCQLNGIQVAAYSPLSKANQTLLNDPVLKRIGRKHKKTVAQVIFRWLIQRGIEVVPGTTKKSRLIENFQIFDFKLNREEMRSIFKLNRNYRKTDLLFAKYNSEYPYEKMNDLFKEKLCEA